MRIWKWTLKLTDLQHVQMPRGAKVLSVQTQGGAPQLWALVDENAPTEPRAFATYGTGNPILEEDINADPGVYVGTYQINDGALVFHIFERA